MLSLRRCGLPQNRPVDVRAKVLAANERTRGPLDIWAPFSRYLALTSRPLRDQNRRNLYGYGKLRAPPSLLVHIVDEFHAQNIKRIA